MKILYVAHRINMPDGYAVHCRSFVEQVKTLGHDIVTYPPIGPIDYSSVNNGPAKRRRPMDYLKKINWRKLKRILHRSNGYISEVLSFLEGLADTYTMKAKLVATVEQYGIDVIIYRQRLFNFAPFAAARQTNIPVVFEVNSMRSMEQKLIVSTGKVTAITRWAERRSAASADAICVVSSAIKQKIESYKTGIPVFVVPNGVDADMFSPRRYPKEPAKKALQLSDKLVMGYVGSYKNWHGLDVSLETLALLVKKDPRWHLLLIGKGPCFPSIANSVRAKGLGSAVTQIEAVPHDRIPEFMAAFDLALMTYPRLPDFYFSPLKMFEYMAMGIPVVTTNIGQMAEIITGDTGVLVEHPTPDAFAQAIVEMQPTMEKWGPKARQLMLESYSWLANAKRIMAICQSVGDGRSEGKN